MADQCSDGPTHQLVDGQLWCCSEVHPVNANWWLSYWWFN